MLVARGLSGFFSRRCRGLKPCLESVPEREDSSPVLMWILGYFWSLSRVVSPRIEWGHARALSFRDVAAVSHFRSRESKQLWLPSRLSHEAFSRGFPTRLSHRAVPRATLVRVDPRLESRRSAGKTGFPDMDGDIWGTLGMWHDPGVPLAFPVESYSS